MAEQKENVMRAVRINKVVLNIGVGEGGEKLRKAVQVLEMLTNHKPVITLGKQTNRDLGVRVGMPIGTKVTLRGNDAEDFLKRALWVVNNKILKYSFDEQGNFSFGIKDYTEFQDMKYDPEIGVFGLDINVSLARPGRRVVYRRRRRSRIPKHHRVGKEDAVEFFKNKFQVEVVE